MKKRKNKDMLTVWSSLFRQYSVLLSAGISAEEATALLSEDGQEPVELIGGVLKRQEEGESFAEAVAASGELPDYAGEVLRVGEQSGRLEESCLSLSAYFDRRSLLEQRLRSSLRYPALLLLMMCAVLAVLIFSVLPVFNRVYESLAGDLSSSSYGYVVLGGVLGRVALAVSLLFCVGALIISGRVRRFGIEALDGLGRRFRLIGDPLRKLDASRLADLLSTMLRSGMTADEAFAQSGSALGNCLIAGQLSLCTEKLQEGESLGTALRESGIFPTVTGRVLLSEAESGRLDRGLDNAAESCSREGMDQLCALIDGVEPCLSVFLTLTVGLSLLSAMLPLVGILSSIG